jgi:hypothetical protein
MPLTAVMAMKFVAIVRRRYAGAAAGASIGEPICMARCLIPNPGGTMVGAAGHSFDTPGNKAATLASSAMTMVHCRRRDWLKDRFGLSWQVGYAGLQDMMSDIHPDRADRVMKAMTTKKIDIQHLKDA